MVKKQNEFNQITPGLWADNKPVPVVGLNGEFRYLGKIFSFKMDNETAKDLIVNKLKTSLIIT